MCFLKDCFFGLSLARPLAILLEEPLWRGFVVIVQIFVSFHQLSTVSSLFHFQSFIHMCNSKNILVKMRQPHDSPTSSDDERNTD